MTSLINAVGESCACAWYKLGLQLEISKESLQIIATNNSSHVENAMTEMLKKWLEECISPTWRAVVTSLRKIKKNKEANLIEKQYILEEVQP